MFTEITEELLVPMESFLHGVVLNKAVLDKLEALNTLFDITVDNHSVVMWACAHQRMYESAQATIVRPMMFHEVLTFLQELSADSVHFTLTKAEYNAYVHIAMKYNDAE